MSGAVLKDGSIPVVRRNPMNFNRKMLTRVQPDAIRIVKTLKSGEHSYGCMACIAAPSCCAMCSVCPCCMDPEYIVHKREMSKYIYIRENSIEWNEPEIVLKSGPCFGVDPCVYDVEDHVNVIYFDNPLFNRMTDQTRVCNECRTCMCGGRGERIQIDSPCCFQLCLRSSFPCPCLPICCPSMYFPCAKRYTLFVDDAQKAIHEITLAMQAAYAIRNTNSNSTGNSSSSSAGSATSNYGDNSGTISAPASAIQFNSL